MEVLFAVTLAAMILLVAVQFLVALTQNWNERDQDRFLQEHADGVLRFFETALRKNISDPRLSGEDRYPALDRPPGMSNLREPMVRMRFPDGSPLFFHGSDSTGPVTAWFGYAPDTGVFALWRPDLQIEVDDYRDFYRTLVTPWVAGVRFYYYDSESDLWEEEEEILEVDGEPQLPDRVRAIFRHPDDARAEGVITIPRDYGNVFIY